jgi:hypothetical protein
MEAKNNWVLCLLYQLGLVNFLEFTPKVVAFISKLVPIPIHASFTFGLLGILIRKHGFMAAVLQNVFIICKLTGINY